MRFMLRTFGHGTAPLVQILIDMVGANLYIQAFSDVDDTFNIVFGDLPRVQTFLFFVPWVNNSG